MRSLGVIIARGGSKRLPRKNLLPLAGTPLVAWMVRAALASRIDRVVLSTDDDEIAAVGRRYGAEVPFLRPAPLATDFAREDAILLHAVDTLAAQGDGNYAAVVLLQPTTPFTQPRHLDACLERLAAGNTACVFTARPVREPPRWMWLEDSEGAIRPLLDGDITVDQQNTQQLRPVFFPSGAAWAVRMAALRAQRSVYCKPIEMVQMEPECCVDIDDDLDLHYAETIAEQYGFRPLAAPEVAS